MTVSSGASECVSSAAALAPGPDCSRPWGEEGRSGWTRVPASPSSVRDAGGGAVCSFPLVQNHSGRVVSNFTRFVLVERRAYEEDAQTPCSPAQTSYAYLAPSPR